MNKMKNFFRMASLLLLAVAAQRAAYAYTAADLARTSGYMKAGITLYTKEMPHVLLPYVTMTFNVHTSGGIAKYYLTSDAYGFAYLQVPMEDTGVIQNGTLRVNLRDLAGAWGAVPANVNYRVDTDPLEGEYSWGRVESGFDTRQLQGGDYAYRLGMGSYDNACLNTEEIINPATGSGNGRYKWQDEGCSFHFACYVQSTASRHDVTFDLTDVANPNEFEARTVDHGTNFKTHTPLHVNSDYKFRAWEVCSPDHPEATVAAPDGALAVTVNQKIRLKPLWKDEPDEPDEPDDPQPSDDPLVQFCHDVEPNTLRVAMKVYDWANPTVPLKNVTVGLCFTVPPTSSTDTGRRDNVLVATTDANGVLKMVVPVENDGFIVVDGVKSTEINLTTVTKIDCGPNADIGWNWDTSTAGRVRNYLGGYGVRTEPIHQGGGLYDDARVITGDGNGNGVPDYAEEGASLCFECYLKHTPTSDGDLRGILYDTTTIANASAFSNTLCYHGSVYTPPATVPINKTDPDRHFVGWRCEPLTTGYTYAYGAKKGAFDYAAPLTLNENLMFVPVWGANPDAEGKIRFQVRMWDHKNYWDHEAQWTANPSQGPGFGQTQLPIDGLTFVLKTYDSIYQTTLPDSVKVPVGQPNTPEGWALSRVEAHYVGKDEWGNDVWDATYTIPNDKLKYLKEGWIIDTDPDEKDLATIDRGLGYGPETLTFDWDWFVKKDDHEGAGLTGVRVIPQCNKHEGGIYPAGLNQNDVIRLSEDMIANGFDFTFQCWVVPAMVVDYDTDGGRPAAYPEERFLPIDSCPLWQQRFVAKNPGEPPTRGADERFEGWYEVLSTDQNGNDTLASAPWNFNTTVTHSMTLKAVYRKTSYDVTTETPIEVTGPGTLTFREILSNPTSDAGTRLTVTVDGGEPVQVLTSTAEETKTVVFGGEVDIKHVVLFTFATTQTETGPLGSASVDNVVWVPYNTGIADAVMDCESEYFEVENLGTDPSREGDGVTFYGEEDKTTISTVDETGRQKTSVVNPGSGASAPTTGTEDYWYLNYDGMQNSLATNAQVFAETPPTLSVGEETSFRVTGITGRSVIRWEALVTPGEAGATPSALKVKVTRTTEGNVTTTETFTYTASDFEGGQFKPGWLDYRLEPISTSITLDFTYTNMNGGRAYVDNIYWKCVLGADLWITDHDDADADHVDLAFEPLFAEGVGQEAKDNWFVRIRSGETGVRVKTSTEREGVETAQAVSIGFSETHASSSGKVWVTVPIDRNAPNGFSRIVLSGSPYKNENGQIVTDGDGATSLNTFGDLKITASTANTMVAVPWTWYSKTEGAAGDLPADKLVRTTSLSSGDLLYAYAGANSYLAWRVDENKQWKAIDTLTTDDKQVGSNAELIKHGSTSTLLPRGTGVWLVRQDPTKPFWLYGQSVTTSATTMIAAKGEGETAHSTMLGNPYAQAVHVNALQLAEGESFGLNDTIIIPNGTDSPMYLEYRNKGTKRNPSTEYGWVWVSLDTSVSPPKNAYNWDVTIPPGLAFWYVRRDGTPLNVIWKLPETSKNEE